MKSFIKNPTAKAAALGVLAGMRTSSALIISTHMLSNDPSHGLMRTPLAFMQSKKTAVVFKLMGLGEFVGDKLPNTPNRTIPSSVVFRCVSGALSGAAIYKAAGHNAFTGGLIGGAAAIAATFGTFFLRKAAVKATRIPDPYIGTIEDALVIGVGLVIVNN